MSAEIHVERDGGIATVRLDGPEKLNVLSRDGWSRLGAEMRALSADESLRCVVVRGTGGRAFSAGSDISEFGLTRDAPEDVRAYSEAIAEGMQGVRSCLHPTVALIEGLCVGGGLEIAVCCDVRLCGASSRFGAPIQRLGLTMAHAELQPLLDLLGPGAVLEILLTGELVDAERALALGLVGRVVPDHEVVDAAYALARRIASGAPLVHRWHKKFVRQIVRGEALDEDTLAEAHDAFRTADYREGRAAFMEKRDPDFRGE